MASDPSPDIAGWPDVFLRTSDGGHIICTDEDARKLGDAIRMVLYGEAVIVRTTLDVVWPEAEES